MNRKTYASILAFTLMAIVFLTGCSSSSAPPVVGITATSPAATATVTTAYGAFTATVTLDGIANILSPQPAVTFTAPSTGASCTFANGTNTETDTAVSGVATSSVCTANYVPGAFTVSVTTLPAAVASISLTNGGGVYAFSLSGTEIVNGGPNSYALAGSVVIDAAGDLVPNGLSATANVAGEQDYNDAFGFTSTQPGGDIVAPEALALVLTNGQGTLTLTSGNASGLFPNGNATETLGVQFVNNNHALITQFDGTATSSGTMDLVSLPSVPNGSFAFTLSGVDANAYAPIVLGGVFTLSSGGLTAGEYDQNDAGTISPPGGILFPVPPVTVPPTAPIVTASAPDAFGRGTITGTGFVDNGANPYAAALNYYAVGPEALRLIDVDVADSGSGSAFGQGTNATAGAIASLGAPCAGNPSQSCGVFGLISNNFGFLYAAAGYFDITDTVGGAFEGVGDNDEEGSVVGGATPPVISGTVNFPGVDGYGSMVITSGNFQDVETLGVYLTDPTLNLNDPNNTTSGLGGAVVAELDALQGTGVVAQQTATATTAFTGNYAFGSQDFFCNICEFDFVGQGAVTNLSFGTTATGLLNDPVGLFGSGNQQYPGVTFMAAPLPDFYESTTGRYSLFTTNATPNPFVVTVPVPASNPPATTSIPFNVVVYQASGTQLFWVDEDNFSLALGSIEQQGDLSLVPAAKRARAPAKTAAKAKQK